MKVLISSLACSPQLGSEALVGFHVIKALSERFDTEIVTSAAMRAPDGVKTHTVAVQFEDPNDVGIAQLLRFEFCQRIVVGQLLRGQAFDAVHRVTPSGYKQSLLSVPSVPFVVGPVLKADSPPKSFQSIFWPRLQRRYTPKAIAAWIGHGTARRVFGRFSTIERLIENAALILVGTEVTLRRLPARLHSRCRLVPYSGVEHNRFTPPAGPRASKLPRLLFVGRLVPYKGVELLLRAAAVARKRCRFELQIVGSGFPPYVDYCRKLAANLKLIDSVTFVGRVPREALIEMYRAADIFCMPSIETYGVAILEAMSTGCAVLVADYNGPGEIVPPGAGLKVPLEAPEQFIHAFAERIVGLIESKRLRRDLGERAREHVLRHHDWERIGASLLEIYAEVFPQAGAAARDRFGRTVVGTL